jgi:hypothetical protein
LRIASPENLADRAASKWDTPRKLREGAQGGDDPGDDEGDCPASRPVSYRRSARSWRRRIDGGDEGQNDSFVSGCRLPGCVGMPNSATLPTPRLRDQLDLDETEHRCGFGLFEHVVTYRV